MDHHKQTVDKQSAEELTSVYTLWETRIKEGGHKKAKLQTKHLSGN